MQDVYRRSGDTIHLSITVQWLSRDSLPARVIKFVPLFKPNFPFPVLFPRYQVLFWVSLPWLKEASCFWTATHFKSWPCFTYFSFLLLWIIYSRKANYIEDTLVRTSTVLHEHNLLFASVCYFCVMEDTQIMLPHRALEMKGYTGEGTNPVCRGSLALSTASGGRRDLLPS